MKNFLVFGTLLISSFIFAQEAESNHEIVGGLVKSTYFHENGKISQEGFYKKGKVHGLWISYDENGIKKSQGTFENGIKTGKWFFWDKNNAKEVDFSENRIAFVKDLDKNVVVKN